MPKVTNEEKQSSQELKAFQADLAKLGFRPIDPEHPLGEFPPERLKNAVCTVTGIYDAAGFNGFVSTFFRLCGYSVTDRVVRGWMKDSRGVTAVQLARLVDLLARFVIEEGRSWFEETAEDSFSDFGEFDPYSTRVFERVRLGIVEALFTTDYATRLKLKRLGIAARLLSMDEGELDAVAGVVRLAARRSWGFDAPGGCEGCGLEDSAKRIGEMQDCRRVADEYGRLASWAEEWADAIDRPSPLDSLPFKDFV